MELTADAIARKLAAHAPKLLPHAEGTRFAAVAAVLRTDPAAEVLLIKRATTPRDPWSGHMAFPGGRMAPGDADTRATAVREAREEVGIDLGEARYLGRLDDVQAVSRARPVDLVIVPHVFLIAGEHVLAPDAREVELCLWVPIAPLLRGENATSQRYERDGVPLELPAWRVGDHVVWGLTYRMLELLFAAIR